ncbi:hypothetical protein AgCh_032186 [Apium graveolens]
MNNGESSKRAMLFWFLMHNNVVAGDEMKIKNVLSKYTRRSCEIWKCGGSEQGRNEENQYSPSLDSQIITQSFTRTTSIVMRKNKRRFDALVYGEVLNEHLLCTLRPKPPEKNRGTLDFKLRPKKAQARPLSHIKFWRCPKHLLSIWLTPCFTLILQLTTMVRFKQTARKTCDADAYVRAQQRAHSSSSSGSDDTVAFSVYAELRREFDMLQCKYDRLIDRLKNVYPDSRNYEGKPKKQMTARLETLV